MKFWQKIFFSTLIIFIIIFDAGVLIITTYSYNYSMKRETDSAVREHGVILSSVESGISNAEKIIPGASKIDENLFATIDSLAAYYSAQGIRLALYNGDNAAFPLGIAHESSLLKFRKNYNTNISEKKVDGIGYLFVASKIPGFEHLTFVYARNINELSLYRDKIGTLFLWLNVAVCGVLGISIFLLLRHMTRPIKILNETTGEIAGGAYGKRVYIKRKDELGELGRTFNSMADSVEKHLQKLTRAAEEKQQFIDNLSHEIKTPVTSILGYSEFVQRANSSEENRIIAAGYLHEAALRLNSLSSKLVDITFLRGEEIELNNVEISTLFSSLENLMGPILTEREIILRTSAEISEISGDEALIMSLLTNLTENAARASGPGDVITVKAYEKEHPVIEVTDTGCGMDEDEIKKITDPFYRIDKSRSRSFGGAGLGLSICKLIAELHGAELKIISKPGVGTTVKIIFTG